MLAIAMEQMMSDLVTFPPSCWSVTVRNQLLKRKY